MAGPEAYPPTPITTSGEIHEHAARRPERAREVERSLQARHQADVLQRADLHQLQGKSRSRDETILNASRGTDEEHFGVVILLELIRDREGGDDVSAGASACKNRSHPVNINQARASSRATTHHRVASEGAAHQETKGQHSQLSSYSRTLSGEDRCSLCILPRLFDRKRSRVTANSGVVRQSHGFEQIRRLPNKVDCLIIILIHPSCV